MHLYRLEHQSRLTLFSFLRMTLVLWCSLLACTVNASDNVLPVVTLKPQGTALHLGKHLSYLPETEILDIDSIRLAKWQARFQAVPGEDPNFGFVDGAYWFRLPVHDPEGLSRDGSWYLELDYPFLDHIEYYYPDANGHYRKMLMGDAYPFDIRDIHLHSYIFPIRLATTEPAAVYFRIKTSTSLQLPLALYSDTKLLEKSAQKLYWLGIFYGIMLVMILYNFFVYLSVRDIAYVHYILYIATILITNMVISGVANQFLWPHSPDMANVAFALIAPTSMFFALCFTRSFLGTKDYGHGIEKLLSGLSLFCLAALSFPFLLGQHLSTVMAVFLPIPICLAIVATGIYGVYKRERRAYFFTAAWGFLITGFIARALLQFDILPNVLLTQYGTQLGATAEVILLSLALADRINTEKADRIEAVEAALEATEEKRKTEQALVFQNFHDPLTGAPNRLLCTQRLSDIIVGDTSEHNKLLVCTVHLNNFHDINFTLGHQAGDQILIQALRNLDKELSGWPGIKALSMAHESPAYIGVMEGVYFAFVLSCSLADDERKIIEGLIKKLAQPVLFNDMTLDLGGNIGIASWPQDDHSAEGLLRKSMIAVRAAKWSKLPIVSYDAHIDQYSESRLSIMGELINALDNHELSLHYQPKINLQQNRVESIEALIRWQHPKHGLLTPSHFIDIAESTGVIQRISEWVIDQGLGYCASLRRQGMDLSIAINISVRNLLNESFADEVIEALQRHQFPAEKLVLEVTESAVIEDMHQTLVTLDILSSYGVNLSLDDFGTGYSSLTYLKKLPIHELKIDRSFVTDMLRNNEDRVIVETTMAIAHQLGLRVVAEGIEDQTTLLTLRDMACDLGQGFFVQQPIPGDALTQWLTHNNDFKPRMMASRSLSNQG